ncbi:hypothetical protein BU24DRAFT_409988 [Aaosphaeria arxii CBS 175.79]|uniref:Uncharacterized protein n=1 Tax=Aaosphaeria arxii CBS 175.79 TaxID=1450172 RepID=A0A6A5XMX5_9PLEO|nr:uncharacterized protein BU24DRAFT_409988 [Aaosphaeria arxii CBS 175.79]KAF2014229.1 hypothetical protein BU24DRAFT_409988 [Aaosphaeria arxii CBS 175.79]
MSTGSSPDRFIEKPGVVTALIIATACMIVLAIVAFSFVLRRSRLYCRRSKHRFPIDDWSTPRLPMSMPAYSISDIEQAVFRVCHYHPDSMDFSGLGLPMAIGHPGEQSAFGLVDQVPHLQPMQPCKLARGNSSIFTTCSRISRFSVHDQQLPKVPADDAISLDSSIETGYTAPTISTATSVSMSTERPVLVDVIFERSMAVHMSS